MSLSRANSNLLYEGLIEELYKTKTLTDELKINLYSVFKETLLEALHIIDNKCVMLIKSHPSERMIFKVVDLNLYPKGEQQNQREQSNKHTCLIYPRYCSCDFFLQKVILQNEAILCKHSLAAILSDILDVAVIEEIGEEAFAELYYESMM